jgi:hypothetical protein
MSAFGTKRGHAGRAQQCPLLGIKRILTAKTSRLFLENVLLTVARNACQIFAIGWGVHLEFENVMISVLVIDDHSIVLQGCRRFLEDAGVTSVLEAGDFCP